MNKLHQILKERYPDKEIVTLKEFTLKISGISKVRYGNNRTDTNYDEISLNNVDEYGVIYVPKTDKESAPANATSLYNQQLIGGDLIILHRGKIGKMGIIGDRDNYKRLIVGNNSMIRIRFAHNRMEDTPWFVMQYLQLPFVKEYINTYIPSSGAVSRKILNPEVLSNLPIPMFDECNGRYKELLLRRKELSIRANKLNTRVQKLISVYKELEDESVDLAINNVESIVSSCENSSEELRKFIAIDHPLINLLHENFSKVGRDTNNILED